MMREHADAGNTVFFSTHVLEVAERLCDRVGVIVKGQLVACGTLDQLRSESGESLESVFLELVNGEAPRGGSDVSVVSG
jgi:ABC-2 type transport system ATP-binding protein